MESVLKSIPQSRSKSVLSQISGLGVDLSRRAFLGGTATGVAALGLGTLWSKSAFASSTSLNVRSDLLMLVNRLTPGFSRAEYQLAQSLGFNAYRDIKLYPGTLDDSVATNFLSTLSPWVNSVPADYLAPPLGQGLSLELSNLALQQKIAYLSILSKYKFRERIAEFWRDHFNVFILKGGLSLVVPTFDRDFVRPFVVDTFPNLLESVEHSAAMLWYLDNQLNKAPTANENLAREILELHAMSPTHYVSGLQNYTQADVLGFAKCLSGWTAEIVDPNPTKFGYFVFHPADHIGGNKTVLGVTIPADSTTPSEGNKVLGILRRHPAVGAFIGYKLARFFLHYTPSPSLVSQVAGVFQTSGGDIRSMVQTILTQANVAALNPPTGPQLKLSLPGHWLERILIALGLPTTSYDILKTGIIDALAVLGNAPYYWAPPDGYPDKEESWASSIFARWQIAAKLFANPSGIEGVTMTDSQLLGLVAPFATTMDIVNNMDAVLTGGVMTTNEKTILDAYIQVALSQGINGYQVLRETYALAVSTPTFMYY